MQHLRLRLRSSVLFALLSLSFCCIITLHTFIWTSTGIEQEESIAAAPPRRPSKLIDIPPIWSAFHQSNIYDVQAAPANTLLPRRSPPPDDHRIDALFHLIRNARNERAAAVAPDALPSIDPTWSFDQFVAQKSDSNPNDTNTHVDTADSASNKTTKLPSNSTGLNRAMTEHDRIQLRQVIHRKLTQWKQEHQMDPTISLADTMNDALVQDEPA